MLKLDNERDYTYDLLEDMMQETISIDKSVKALTQLKSYTKISMNKKKAMAKGPTQPSASFRNSSKSCQNNSPHEPEHEIESKKADDSNF